MLNEPSEQGGSYFSPRKRRRAVLTKNFEFRRAYRYAKSYVSPLVVTYVLPKKSGGVRVGVSAAKKIGNAVVRNRARRVVKAAFFGVSDMARGNWDIVFVCRTRTAQAKSDEVRSIIINQLSAAGVIKR